MSKWEFLGEDASDSGDIWSDWSELLALDSGEPDPAETDSVYVILTSSSGASLLPIDLIETKMFCNSAMFASNVALEGCSTFETSIPHSMEDPSLLDLPPRDFCSAEPSSMPLLLMGVSSRPANTSSLLFCGASLRRTISLTGEMPRPLFSSLVARILVGLPPVTVVVATTASSSSVSSQLEPFKGTAPLLLPPPKVGDKIEDNPFTKKGLSIRLDALAGA
mmetsp:Transcript_4750/g.9221  ORF Transcript_4750/g.9221 Transcript_4750/m.9221 type:complete len:221 (+) Transcript_4750:594-1256(+)